MDFIKTSSLVTDFWDLLFYPLLVFSLCVLELKIVVGKERFTSRMKVVNGKMQEYSKVMQQHEQLSKAMPILYIFILFSFVHLFSIIVSCVPLFFEISFSFRHDSILTEGTVLNVWKYYPHIEDIYSLEKVVLYNAKKNGLGTFKLLSSEGVMQLPELVVRSIVDFSVILVVLSLIYVLIRVFKRGFIKRFIIVLRAILALVLAVLLLFSVSFLRKNHTDDYITQAWTQLEIELLSSGAPPKTDYDIGTKKKDEASDWVNHRFNHFCTSIGVGSVGLSFSFYDHHWECQTYSSTTN